MIFLRINFTLVTNVQTSKQRVKIWQLIGGPLSAGAPSHGTSGTMDNPALMADARKRLLSYRKSAQIPSPTFKKGAETFSRISVN